MELCGLSISILSHRMLINRSITRLVIVHGMMEMEYHGVGHILSFNSLMVCESGHLCFRESFHLAGEKATISIAPSDHHHHNVLPLYLFNIYKNWYGCSCEIRGMETSFVEDSYSIGCWVRMDPPKFFFFFWYSSWSYCYLVRNRIHQFSTS